MNEVLHIINEMSPFLLLGFLFAGLLHAFVPSKFYTKYLSKRNFKSVVNAALLGIPLPLCSCGVIPTAMSLRKEGASKGATTSFLIATPQTGVDSIFATYSLMGLPFAITRPIVALITAIFGGQITNLTDKSDSEETNSLEEKEEHCCCHSHKEEPKEEHCCCHDKAEESEGHCCHCEEEIPQNATLMQRFGIALRYAFVDMMEDIGKWLVIGLVIAGLITVFVPQEFFAIFADNTWLSMLLVLAISIPMYVCATGSIPIAVALMMKGLTPGAALVLLMAGPAANMASILVIQKRLGTRTLLAYLISIIGGAIAGGFVIDYLLPREWFTSTLVQQGACCEATGTWFQWTCTAILALLLLNVAWKKLKK
ncbi:MAG: SO_0444 family Cu/Zn efflux transporter [Alloprevotella sp.]|nr:SO_0444 family Cu/Zn efflux transporter [Alloprevotella sp.]